MNSSSATVTVTVTAQAPPVGTPEAITVTAANYRGDQKRWQINGTDNLSSNQILTIKNVGPAGSTKNVVLGTAVVTAGAWTLDIRNIATGLIPVQGDRVVAVRTDVTPNITSAPVTAVLTKLN